MAVLKQRLLRKNTSGGYDTLRIETDSGMVLRPDGSTVETSLTSMQTAINGKAASNHTHSFSQISGSLTVNQIEVISKTMVEHNFISTGQITSTPALGDTVNFGGHTWTVIQVANGAMYLTLKNIEQYCPYFTDSIVHSVALTEYKGSTGLNFVWTNTGVYQTSVEFANTFSTADKARMLDLTYYMFDMTGNTTPQYTSYNSSAFDQRFNQKATLVWTQYTTKVLPLWDINAYEISRITEPKSDTWMRMLAAFDGSKLCTWWTGYPIISPIMGYSNSYEPTIYDKRPTTITIHGNNCGFTSSSGVYTSGARMAIYPAIAETDTVTPSDGNPYYRYETTSIVTGTSGIHESWTKAGTGATSLRGFRPIIAVRL